MLPFPLSRVESLQKHWRPWAQQAKPNFKAHPGCIIGPCDLQNLAKLVLCWGRIVSQEDDNCIGIAKVRAQPLAALQLQYAGMPVELLSPIQATCLGRQTIGSPCKRWRGTGVLHSSLQAGCSSSSCVALASRRLAGLPRACVATCELRRLVSGRACILGRTCATRTHYPWTSMPGTTVSFNLF